jgi:succinate dehydrogenase / fumarate reductase cytochrome b subunit
MVHATVKDTRPVNLDMTTIRLPLPAVVSILTRISGVVLFGAAAIMLWLLDHSLSDEAGFQEVGEILASPLAKAVLFAILFAVIYHALAGIKHLVADFGYGESLEGGVLGARLVIAATGILTVLAGVWIW